VTRQFVRDGGSELITHVSTDGVLQDGTDARVYYVRTDPIEGTDITDSTAGEPRA
jgi:hypothetical protein